MWLKKKRNFNKITRYFTCKERLEGLIILKLFCFGVLEKSVRAPISSQDPMRSSVGQEDSFASVNVPQKPSGP